MAPASLESIVTDHESRIRTVEKVLGLSETVRDHEARIRLLETSTAKLTAYVSIGAFLASILAQILLPILGF